MECKHWKRVFVLLFLFSNGGYKLLKFFHFRTHKVEFEMFAKEFSRKRGGILISLQSYLKLVAFRKKLKVVESERLMCCWMEFSCEIISNSKWKVKSKFSFHLCKSKVFKIWAFHFSTFFFALFFQLLRSQL